MNRNRILTAAGATMVGLLGVTALTGAASASAAPPSTTATSRSDVGTPGSDTAKPATPPAGSDAAKPATPPATPPVTAPTAPKRTPSTTSGSTDEDRARSARRASAVAAVKHAVLAKYPSVTITSVSARAGGGWTVSVLTARGRPATVFVDGNLKVGSLVLAHARSGATHR